MKEMELKSRVLGIMQTNCYFLKNTRTGQLLIVDPGDEPEKIEQQILSMGAVPAAILLTHGHFDHMLAASVIKEKYGVPVYAHREEKEVLENPEYNLSGHFGKARTAAADCWLEDKDEISIAGFSVRVLHTPGHTKGGVCYYFPEEKVLMSGDTLFSQSVGRTDFPTSSTMRMKESIRRLLEELPEDTQVFPGHMESTTIGYEKRYNPFA